MSFFFVSLVLAAATTASAATMETQTARDLVGVLRYLGILPDLPSTAADIELWRNLSLLDAPECPLALPNEVYSCDSLGRVDRLSLRSAQPANTNSLLALGVVAGFGRNGTTTFSLYNFVGYLTLAVYFERIHVENSAFLSDFTNSFPLQGAHVTLVNVTFDSPMGINNQTITKLQTCSFTNVTMRCPVPQQLWRCFGNATVSPPCTPSRTPFYTYRTHLLRCSVYGVCDATCFDPVAPGHQCPWTNGFRKYLPATLGFSTIELALGLPNEAKSLYVGSVKSTAGYVAKVELLDWRASPPAWAVVFDRLPVREVGVNTDIVTLPPILTNRVRVTLEQWLDTDAIDRVDLFTEVWPERAPPPQPRKGKCPTATSTNSRSMLDETIGDSFCLGRVCQMACAYPAANLTFDRVVKARFLVLEGGEQWSGGKLVATPSDETRVYELDGNETDFFNSTGDVRRARLVGDPVSGSLPAPTLPNRLGLPGVLVKTWRRTRPSGGEVVGAGNITAPANETIVSAVTVLNQTFATTASGRVLQRDGAAWADAPPDALTAFVLNRGEPHPARKLAVVGGRLVVVVAAHTIVHDGSARPLLVKRRLVQTAIDVLDVASGVWYNEVLAHGIERNVSDVDVVVWNATAFGVVDRASGATAAFEWRAFPYELQRCAANNDCQACLTSEANEEPCRWCGARCVSRLVSCMGSETSTVNASSAACAGPTVPANTTATATVANATESVSTLPTTTLPPNTTAPAASTTLPPTTTSLAASTEPAGISASATIGLAVGVPIAVLALVGLLAGVLLWSRRKRADDDGVELPAAKPAEELPAAKPAEEAEPAEDGGAYGDVREVRESAYEAPDSKLEF